MNWTLGDIEKLQSKGFRINIQPIPKNRVVIGVKKIISLNGLRDKAQSEFNLFIRNRDQDKGCISCQYGKVEQAGHFYSAGQYTALRFNEDNVHGQCLQDNYFKHGNLLVYRERLIGRIGIERFKLLERSSLINRVHKWSRVELEIIYKMYREKNALL